MSAEDGTWGRRTSLAFAGAEAYAPASTGSVTALRSATPVDRGRPLESVGSGRHVVLEALSLGERADLWIGAADTASSLEQMVVIKRFHPLAAAAAWARLVAELELASGLSSEHVVRTLEVGLDPDGCFQVSEYAEGATLQACLAWTAATRTPLPNAALARILWALLSAVTQADQAASSALGRALVRGPVAVDDVFITYTGQVKLLGFKAVQRQAAAEDAAPRPTAIDALLGQHLTPDLRQVLLRLRRTSDVSANERSEEILQAIQRWRSEELGSDGRLELARLMRPIARSARAEQALRVATAFSKLRGPLRRVSSLGLPDDAPESGYRRIST